MIYGGVRYTQVRHAVQCMKCLETIESTHPHDFKWCLCKTVGIDGGLSDGNRILGDPSDIEDRRMYCAIIKNKRIWLPLHIKNPIVHCTQHSNIGILDFLNQS